MVYKVTCKMCLSVCVVNPPSTLQIELNVTSNMWIKKYSAKNPETFAAHFAQHFNQKMTPQQCHEFMSLGVDSTINHIGYTETWDKYSCALCMEEILEISSHSQRRYGSLINALSEVYVTSRLNTRLHRFPGTDDSLKVIES